MVLPSRYIFNTADQSQDNLCLHLHQVILNTLLTSHDGKVAGCTGEFWLEIACQQGVVVPPLVITLHTLGFPKGQLFNAFLSLIS